MQWPKLPFAGCYSPICLRRREERIDCWLEKKNCQRLRCTMKSLFDECSESSVPRSAWVRVIRVEYSDSKRNGYIKYQLMYQKKRELIKSNAGMYRCVRGVVHRANLGAATWKRKEPEKKLKRKKSSKTLPMRYTCSKIKYKFTLKKKHNSPNCVWGCNYYSKTGKRVYVGDES